VSHLSLGGISKAWEAVMFLSGEFARIARVSKRQLRHWEAIGLLEPAHTDPQTGYRYYSAQQLPRINRILALKELGLSMDHIIRMMHDEITDDEIHGMLLMQKAELEQQLLDHLARFQRIESRLQKRHTEPDVVLKSVPAQHYLSLRSHMDTMGDAWAAVKALTQSLPDHVDRRSLSHFVAIIHTEEFMFEDVETMATLIHLGSPNVCNVSYGAIGQWIEANDYRITGPQREVFIEFADDEADLVIEIQFPVEKRAPTMHLLNHLLD
jgi:DNA-binding transcriptional MerR regulator